MVGATHAHQCLHPPPGRPAPIYLLIQGDRALASNPAPAGPLRPIHPHPHPHPHPPPTPRPSSSPQCRLPASSAPGILELEVGGDVKVVVDDQLSEFCKGGSEGVVLGSRLVSGGRSGLARGGVVG